MNRLSKNMGTPLKQILRSWYHFAPLRFHALSKAVCGGKRRKSDRPDGVCTVQLPWGLPIKCDPDDLIGSELLANGVYDLCVCEAIWRLLNAGETAVDVGANIGQMSSLMAARVGAHGQVFSFEPEPSVFVELFENVQNWANFPLPARILPAETALSDVAGEGMLCSPSIYFSGSELSNRMVARVVTPDSPSELEGMPRPIALQTLDQCMANAGSIGVCKVDVEGHELQVFKGASDALRSKRIRDIVFEDWDEYPTKVTNYLEAAGYSVLTLSYRPWGISASPAHERKKRAYPPGFIATSEPERALRVLNKLGWACLQS